MADTTKIPLKPSNWKDFSIGKREKDCLVYVGLTGCKNSEAFGLFYPEYTQVTPKGDFALSEEGQRRCVQFFGKDDHKRFLTCYKSTLKAFLGGSYALEDESTEITEERKGNAIKSLLNKAIKLVETGADIDPDTLKDITDIFKKLGVLKEEEAQEETPRRYLPELCSRCRYKQFIDEQVKLGNIVEQN